jgi:Flp pilus assembly protein TadG
VWRRLGQRDQRRDQPRDERGATLVEAAIVLPVLVTLLLGIIDFGFAFNDYVSIRQGTREAAREAAVVTNPAPGSGTWASNGCSTTPDYSAASPADGYDLMCYAKQRIGIASSNVRISLYWVAANNYSANFTDPSPNYSVIVCTQAKLNSLTGMFSPILNNTVVNAKTEIRIEDTSANMTHLTPPYQETAFTSWPSSCTTP